MRYSIEDTSDGTNAKHDELLLRRGLRREKLAAIQIHQLSQMNITRFDHQKVTTVLYVEHRCARASILLVQYSSRRGSIMASSTIITTRTSIESY